MRLLHLNSLCNFKNTRVIQGKTGLPFILKVDIKTIVHTTQWISSRTYRMSFSSLIISMALDSHISSLDADFLFVKWGGLTQLLWVLSPYVKLLVRACSVSTTWYVMRYKSFCKYCSFKNRFMTFSEVSLRQPYFALNECTY